MVFPAEFQVAVDAPDPQVDGLGTVGLQKIELILFQIPLGEPGIEGEEEFAAVVVGLMVFGESFRWVRYVSNKCSMGPPFYRAMRYHL